MHSLIYHKKLDSLGRSTLTHLINPDQANAILSSKSHSPCDGIFRRSVLSDYPMLVFHCILALVLHHIAIAIILRRWPTVRYRNEVVAWRLLPISRLHHTEVCDFTIRENWYILTVIATSCVNMHTISKLKNGNFLELMLYVETMLAWCNTFLADIIISWSTLSTVVSQTTEYIALAKVAVERLRMFSPILFSNCMLIMKWLVAGMQCLSIEVFINRRMPWLLLAMWTFLSFRKIIWRKWCIVLC